MKRQTIYFATVFVFIVFLGLTACERIVTGTEKTEVLSFSESIVDNLFAGWASNNYAVFTRDFDTNMQKEIPETSFAALKHDLGIKLGEYNSRKVDQITRSDEFYVVDYQASFGKEELVKITMVFHASDHSIAFIALKSEKVSWSTFN
jgi:hypothetical protein